VSGPERTGLGIGRFRLHPKFIPPLVITLILIGAHWTAGVLRGYEAVAIAIVAALVTDLLVGRALLGERRGLNSAYISGISVSILLRSPVLWPFAVGSILSILSKYVLRVRGRHIWNPSNFGICVLLFFVPWAVAPLSVQWGNDMIPMAVIWTVGIFTIWKAGRAHVTLTYLAAFTVFAFVRSLITGHTFLAELAPLTGPMYQLFALFMVTDPKTTVSTRSGRMIVVVLVAAVEMVLRLMEIVYAPFYALFLVGPAAMLWEEWRSGRGTAGAVATPEGPPASAAPVSRTSPV
jgi:enediyne biosynthesis protein E5